MMPRSRSSWVICLAARDKPKARLICFPHGGGGVHAFRAWPAGLPDWLEVLAINPPGRGARLREAPIEDMGGMVEGAISALAPFLDLPFLLFGHSVGALVAFEAARALEAQGLRPLHVLLSGYADPVLAKRHPSLSKASNEELITSIAGLGLLPPDVIGADGLLELLLPPLRADFGLAERHEVADGARITAPLTVLGGNEDPIVEATGLRAWRVRAEGAFEVRLFNGGHFFTETARDELLAAVAGIAALELARLPPSIMLGPQEDYPLDACLHDHFRRQANATPDALALHGATRQLTFGGLDQESDLLARQLLSLGCGVDRMVAILMETSADFVAAYLAILKAGGAYLPIPPVTPDRAIGEILESVRPIAVVASPAQARRLAGRWPAERCVILGEGWVADLKSRPLPALESMAETPGPDSLAYCVMTSGTTGKPKGIGCPHKGAVNSYWWRFAHLPYGESEREACNIFFVWEVLRPLLMGRPAYIIPDDVIFDPRRLIDFLEAHAITRVLFTPSLFEQVLNVGGAAIARRLPALRMVILNGEVVSAALAERARAVLPGIELINDYSISECHDVATSRIGEGPPAPGSRSLPAGKVMANVRVYILGDNLAPVPWGVPGEVYVAGAALARGYFDLPEMTAERFLPDPFQGGQERMFRTGDAGRALPDGQLEIQGRSHFMIKLRGYSVVPSAVEAAIAAFPAIGAVIAVPIDDPATGQAASLAAYIVGRERSLTGEDLTALRAHLKDRLPAYAIPADLIELPELPIQASTGKVDRKKLPPPSPQPGRERRAGVPPLRAGVERDMSALWSKVLGRPTIAPSDSFFDLGGHSLLAIKLALSAENRFGVALNVVDVFNYPTLGAFSEYIARKLGERRVPEPKSLSKARPRHSCAGPADIAVIGMACRFPGCDCPEQLWDKLMGGVECIRKFSDEELRARGVPERLISNPAYMRAGAILEDVALFDPAFFGLSEREAILMDPQHRLFLECCWEALERAGYAPSGHDVLTGIYAGCYLPTYLVHHLGAARHLDAGDPASFLLTEIGNDKDYLASRAAYVLGLEGPAISVQTSCSTGLIAIAEAAEALRCGRCDMALAGASSITFPQGGYLYAEGFIGARDGHCRTFDHGASGTILGDGVGVVVLRRLEDALTAGDTVLAVIKGYATNNDGAARAGFSAPSVRGQAQVISAAFNMAEADASSISYVEAHGTATLIGDPIEVRALTQAFRQHTAAKGFCVIGSAKANLGHSNIAAGVAGFMKTVLMLRHRQIPPLINFTRPNPELKLEETPFRIETVASAWEALGSEPRRAGVSSFGIGGTNAHMILEEAPDTAAAPSEPACVEILPVSAKTASALCAVTRRLAGDLGANPAPPVSEAAAALQLGRAAFPWRRAEIATSREEAVARLSSQRDVERCAQISGGIALVFPGQGAKLTGLDPDLMTRCPAFARVFAKCRELFLERAVDIDDLFDEAEAARLMAKAPGLQAALFATEYALGQTLMAFGLRPTALAGHSLGQIVAATIAGVMPLEQAVSLVAVRAEAMEEAAPGAMLSVSAGGPELDGLMGSYPGVVIAASNSPRDIVVSGPEQDIAKLEQAAAKAGLACRRLAVSRAFHSPLMKDTALRVADAAASMRFDPPNIPVACNITGGWLDAHSAKNAGEYWSRHILAPVAFAANAMALSALRPSLVVEAGPGRSLTRLISECVRAAKEARPIMLSAMRHPSERGASDWEALCRCLARLWESGFDVDWRAFREGRSRRRATLSTYPFERRRCWPANDAALSQEAVPHIETKLPPQERFYVPSFRQVSAPSTSRGRAPICWLLLRDGGGSRGALADVLERELRAYGDDVEGLDRAGRAQLASVLERLGGREKAARVLSLWSLQEGGRRQRAQEQTAEALELAKTLASRRNASPLFVFAVFERAFTSPGPSADPDAAGAVGPLLVLGQEHPAISVRFIDVDLTRAPGIVPLARQIASECAVAQPRREATVMLRAGRFVERFDPLSLGDAEREAGRRRLAEGPHIVTGGLGRIGLALARHLTEIGAAVVLTSRRPAIEPVSAAQGLIEVRRLNLASRQETESLLLDVARRYGRLGGIFHAAGLARLAGLCDISPDLLSAELEPKVSGTINLEKAIRQIRGDLHIEPSFVMTFSSLASVLGGLGMAAYASANRIMDALAAATSAPGRTPWISVRWDDWDFDYGEQQVGAYAQTRARFSISPEEALGAIEAILGEETLRDVLVSATPLQPRLDRWVNGREPFAVQPPEKPNGAGDPDARRGSSPAEDRVRAAYAKVLGAEKACLDDNFFDLGGDSLLATQIVLELGRYPGGTAGLRVTDVFDHPTIRGLAAKLAPSSHTKPQPALETDNTQGDAL